MKSLIQTTINSFQKLEDKLGKRSAFFYIVISTLFFSLMSLCVKFVQAVPVYQCIYLRALLNVIFCFLISNYQKYDIISKDQHTNKLLLWRGAMGGIGLSLYFHPLYLLPLSIVAVLQRISPLWVGIFGALLYKEPYKLIHIITTIISFSGILLIFKPGFIFGHNEISVEKSHDYLIGLILLLMHTIVVSFITLTIRELRDKCNVLIVVFYFNLFNLIFAGVGEYFEKTKVLNSSEWVLVILIGIFGLGGHLTKTRALFLEKAFIISIIDYLNVVFGFLFDIFILNESMDLFAYVGILIIMISMGILIYSEGKE